VHDVPAADDCSPSEPETVAHEPPRMWTTPRRGVPAPTNVARASPHGA
jgi:hypothetical protein